MVDVGNVHECPHSGSYNGGVFHVGDGMKMMKIDKAIAWDWRWTLSEIEIFRFPAFPMNSSNFRGGYPPMTSPPEAHRDALRASRAGPGRHDRQGRGLPQDGSSPIDGGKPPQSSSGNSWSWKPAPKIGLATIQNAGWWKKWKDLRDPTKKMMMNGGTNMVSYSHRAKKLWFITTVFHGEFTWCQSPQDWFAPKKIRKPTLPWLK